MGIGGASRTVGRPVDWIEWAGVGWDLLLTFIMVGLKKRCHQSRSTNATCEGPGVRR